MAVSGIALAASLLCAPVSAKAPKGTVDFHQGFEGSLGDWTLQYEFDRPMSDSFSFVPEAREGQSAAKFTIRQGYSPYGWNESVESAWNDILDQGPGSEFYYAFSTKFPADWSSPPGWALFLQFYTRRFSTFTGPAPIAFDARGNHVDVVFDTGKSPIAGGAQFSWKYNKRFRVLQSLNKGRWNDFVLHVKWEYRRTGVFEVWQRFEGRTKYKKVLSLKKIPTLRWNPSAGPDSIGTIKMGLYRKSYCPVPVQLDCTNPLGTQPDSVIYHDGFSRGSSFAAVAAPNQR